MKLKPNVVLSLSGGMDSSTLLLKCLKEYENVIAISFDYGQKHKVELSKAQSLIKYINNNPLRIYPSDHDEGGFGKKYSKVTHRIIKLEGLSDLLDSALVEGNKEVPEGFYTGENQKETVVPNRNKIFSSIIQAVALSAATRNNSTCDIALGIHAGDHCIPEGELIVTKMGKKTMSELKIGDEVLSFDKENNKLSFQKVINKVNNGLREDILRIEVEDEEGLSVTSNHKVYKIDKNLYRPNTEWKEILVEEKAENLKPGDLVLTSYIKSLEEDPNESGMKVLRKIESINKEEAQKVWDITVENNHNFFAGKESGILVSNSIYPDCRQEFRDIDFEAFKVGNWDSERVNIYTPYLQGDKFDILKDGENLCEYLGLNFDEVYSRTNTSYKPLYIKGKWYSDYKSASSVERSLAFVQLGKPDPVEFADEKGPVSWEVAKAHALKVEKEFKK